MPRLALGTRLLLLVLGLLSLTLLGVGTLLDASVRRYARAEATRTISSQLTLVARQLDSSQTQEVQNYAAFQALASLALASGTWGVLVLPQPSADCPDVQGKPSRYCFTDTATHPTPPDSVLAQARQAGQTTWQKDETTLPLQTAGQLTFGLALRPDATDLAAGVTRSYLPIALLALLLAGLLGAWLLRWGLSPLRRIATLAGGLGAADLATRLPEGQAADEVGSLAHSLNAMLSRLEGAFNRLEREESRTRAFAADASHELRTPLAAIAGTVDILQRPPTGDEADDLERQRLLANLQRESRRATRLVEDLLALSRLDSGAGELHLEGLALRPLCTALLGNVADLAPQLDWALEATDIHLKADRLRLEGAIWNLLRNAAQYTTEGEKVTLKADQDGDWICLSVQNPAQLPAEFVPRLFDRFARGPHTRSGDGGSGLGLSIVKATALAHGGDVFAHQRGGLLEIGFRIPA